MLVAIVYNWDLWISLVLDDFVLNISSKDKGTGSQSLNHKSNEFLPTTMYLGVCFASTDSKV